MKILMLANARLNYIRNTWIGPMLETYDTIYVSIPQMRKFYSNIGLQRYLFRILRENDIQFIFVYSDGLQSNILDDGFYETVGKFYKIITYHADDEPEQWYEMNIKKDFRYHVVATHSREAARRRRTGFYLPWGYNPSLHYRIPGMQKKYDVLFIGVNKSRQISSRIAGELEYYEDGEIRQSILTDVYEFCRKKGYIFGLFGLGWEKHPVLCQCAGGYLKDEEIVRVVNEAKIVINVAFSKEQDFNGYQTKTRHFEIGGCGSFQITNYNPELNELFGGRMAMIHSRDEMLPTIEYYLTHEKEREEQADYIYRECISSHTMQHRIKTLMDESAARFHLENNLSPGQRDDVIKIPVSGFNGLKALIRQIEKREIQIESGQRYLFYDKCLELLSSNLSLLYREDKPVIVSDMTVEFQYPWQVGTYDYLRPYLIKRGQAVEGRAKACELLNAAILKKHLIWKQEGEAIYFLTNFLIKGSMALSVLKGFANEAEFNWEKNCCFTGEFVNDGILVVEDETEDNHEKWIRRLLNRAGKDYEIAFYGKHGNIAEIVREEIYKRGTADGIYFFDINHKENVKCYRHSLIEKDEYVEADCFGIEDFVNGRKEPKVIAITSCVVERELWEEVCSYECRCLILPLYDLQHENWKYF